MCLGSQAGNTCSNMQLGAACPENLPVSLQHRTLGSNVGTLGGQQEPNIPVGSQQPTVTGVRPPTLAPPF